MVNEPIVPRNTVFCSVYVILNTSCKKIASGKYDKADTERLFELAKKGRYPGIFSELAESFGMMMVKIEAREFRLKQIIEELEPTKAKLPGDSDGVSEG